MDKARGLLNLLHENFLKVAMGRDYEDYTDRCTGGELGMSPLDLLVIHKVEKRPIDTCT